MARETDKAYIAAYIDGEGYIGLTKRESNGSSRQALRPTIQICNTHLPTLEWILEVFPGGWMTKPRKKFNSTKYYYTLKYTKASVVSDLLTQVLPYLKEKVDRARIIIDWCNRRGVRGKRYSRRDWEDHNRLLIRGEEVVIRG